MCETQMQRSNTSVYHMYTMKTNGKEGQWKAKACSVWMAPNCNSDQVMVASVYYQQFHYIQNQRPWWHKTCLINNILRLCNIKSWKMSYIWLVYIYNFTAVVHCAMKHFNLLFNHPVILLPLFTYMFTC